MASGTVQKEYKAISDMGREMSDCIAKFNAVQLGTSQMIIQTQVLYATLKGKDANGNHVYWVGMSENPEIRATIEAAARATARAQGSVYQVWELIRTGGNGKKLSRGWIRAFERYMIDVARDTYDHHCPTLIAQFPEAILGCEQGGIEGVH